MQMNDLVEQARSGRNALAEVLDAYDKAIKSRKMEPSSREAIEGYTQIIRSFRGSTIKEDIDPNSFSFGKQQKYNTLDLGYVSKQLPFTEPKGKKPAKGVVPQRMHQEPMQINITHQQMLQLSFIAKHRVFRKLRLVGDTGWRHSKQVMVAGLRLFRRLRRNFKVQSTLHVVSLRELALTQTRNENSFVHSFAKLKINSQRMRESVALTEQTYRSERLSWGIYTMREYLDSIQMRRSQVQHYNTKAWKLSCLVFFRRLLLVQGSVHMTQELRGKEQNCHVFVQGQRKRNMYNKLRESHQKLGVTTKTLSKALTVEKLRCAFSRLGSNVHKQNKLVRQLARNKIYYLVRLLRALGVAKGNNQAVGQIDLFASTSRIESIIHWKRSRDYLHIMVSYLRGIQLHEVSLRTKLLTGHLRTLQRGAVQRVRTTSDITLLRDTINNMKQNQTVHWLQTTKRAKITSKTLCQFLITTRSKEAFSRMIRSNRANKTKTSITRLVQSHNQKSKLTKCFQALKRYSKRCTFQREIVSIVLEDKARLLTQLVFGTLKAEAVTNKILGIKQGTLERLRGLKSKQQAFQELRASKLCLLPLDVSRLRRCYALWKAYSQAGKKQRVLLESVEVDNRLHTQHKCFQVLKISALGRHSQRSLDLSKATVIIYRRKERAFGMVVSGAIRTIKLRLLSERLRVVLLRQCFSLIRQCD